MDKKEVQKSKNFIMRVSEKMHTDIKTAAAIRGISISLLIHRALYRYLRIEDIDKECK